MLGQAHALAEYFQLARTRADSAIYQPLTLPTGPKKENRGRMGSVLGILYSSSPASVRSSSVDGGDVPVFKYSDEDVTLALLGPTATENDGSPKVS